MMDQPYSFQIDHANEVLSSFDNHIQRRLSAMEGQFLDRQAYEHLLAQDDRVLYEVYELQRPAVAGELRHGLSIVYPGKVGDEYFMTKGHFHEVVDTGEVYYCLKGEGALVMETPEGEAAVEDLRAGEALYVPPRWAHRSVNTSLEHTLVTFFIYPANAGHDYRSIEEHGFKKLVLAGEDGPRIIDNPRWLPPEARA